MKFKNILFQSFYISNFLPFIISYWVNRSVFYCTMTSFISSFCAVQMFLVISFLLNIKINLFGFKIIEVSMLQIFVSFSSKKLWNCSFLTKKWQYLRITIFIYWSKPHAKLSENLKTELLMKILFSLTGSLSNS